MKRLRALLRDADKNRGPFRLGKLEMLGNIPVHYKRISVDENEADRLAQIGALQLAAAFTMRTYYTQAVIAGAMLSGDYDTVIVVTPSQYGKSHLMGHVAPLMAYMNQKLTIAGATANTTDIIMTYIRQSIRSAAPDIKQAILGETMRKIDRLDSSLSKSKVSFAKGGYIEAVTLGDMYSDTSRNKAIGRGTGYIIDEAAQVSEQALAEIGRREFSSINGKKNILVMISNPHKPGYFYDQLTQPDPDKRTIIIWMDCLTAAQEGRWSAQHILLSEFAKHEETRVKYLMCELPRQGVGMFDEPKIAPTPEGRRMTFMGIDAAYKGKDNLCAAVISQGEKVSVDDIYTVKTTPWVDGKTSEIICDNLAKLFREKQCAFACIDTGYGVWLIEGLNRRGIDCMGINFAQAPTQARIRERHYTACNAANVRAEMHLDLKYLIEDGMITFTEDAYNAVSDVLPYVTSSMKANGNIIVSPKPEIKALIGKSPDELDAVLLAIHACIIYSMYNTSFIP